MGWYDYFTDLSSSLTIGTAYAEERSNAGPTVQHGTSDMSTGGEVTSNGMGTAQQRGGATPKGGVSTSVPAAGTNEESSSEAEANKADKAKQDEKDAEKEAPAGHKPGDGGEGSGQAGPGAAGPYGGPLKAAEGEDDEEEAGGDDEEEEEEEDEPEDIKPKLEEGTLSCFSLLLLSSKRVIEYIPTRLQQSNSSFTTRRNLAHRLTHCLQSA